MKVGVFHYEIVKEIPLRSLNLKPFKNHRRLKVFFNKGCKCVSCDKTGTRLILGRGGNNLHWDVYTSDLIPITVDHIIPKSKGGGEELENKQPMCHFCNSTKGNGDKLNGLYGHFCNWPRRSKDSFNYNISVGDEIYFTSNRKMKFFGVFQKTVINPFTKELSCMVEGNLKTMQPKKRCFKL